MIFVLGLWAFVLGLWCSDGEDTALDILWEWIGLAGIVAMLVSVSMFLWEKMP